MGNQAGFKSMIAEPRRWDFIAGMIKELGYQTFVEVGCKEGRTTGHVLKECPEVRVIAIDPWMVQEKTTDKTRETYDDWDFAKIEKEFWDNVGENRDRCTFFQQTSLRMAEDLAKQGPFDMVFIDALHDYPSVVEDIKAWFPLIRDGGALVGHDYNHKWPGVERAVADSFNLMDVGVGPDSVWFVVKT